MIILYYIIHLIYTSYIFVFFFKPFSFYSFLFNYIPFYSPSPILSEFMPAMRHLLPLFPSQHLCFSLYFLNCFQFFNSIIIPLVSLSPSSFALFTLHPIMIPDSFTLPLCLPFTRIPTLYSFELTKYHYLHAPSLSLSAFSYYSIVLITFIYC